MSPRCTLSFLLASYLFLVFFPSVPGQSFSFSSFALLRLSGFLLGRLGIFVLLVVSQLSWLHLRLSDLLRSLGPSPLLPTSPSIGVMWTVAFFAFNLASISSLFYAYNIPVVLTFRSILTFFLSVSGAVDLFPNDVLVDFQSPLMVIFRILIPNTPEVAGCF